jgi:hypothetical protein
MACSIACKMFSFDKLLADILALVLVLFFFSGMYSLAAMQSKKLPISQMVHIPGTAYLFFE